jgi:hypothetical protein
MDPLHTSRSISLRPILIYPSMYSGSLPFTFCNQFFFHSLFLP